MIDQIKEIPIEKLVTIMLAVAFMFLVLSMTTCSIHMNMYNAGEEKTEVAKISAERDASIRKSQAEADATKLEAQAKLEAARQESAAEMERLKVVERLIKDQNVDPIAARCAVEGWAKIDNPIVCQAVATGQAQTEVAQ